MRAGDTIVALSSGGLPSGVAVVRLSGPATAGVVEAILGRLPEPRRLVLADVKIGDTILDRGLVTWFPAPRSFTGEDCAELQVHGSPAGVRAILRTLTAESGIRLAEAGEFTRRAFENGKLDLTEIEGLGDLLDAETESQRKQALMRASGGLSAAVTDWRERLLDLRAEIEARLDFSDEGDVSAELPASFGADIATLMGQLSRALESVTRGRIVREGVRVALAGAPNAGKSSLVNALARSDVAIVTEEPGTTRDVREVAIDLDGQLLIVVDLAGLRDTDSKAEAEGVRRARLELSRADLVLKLEAPDAGLEEEFDVEAPIWRIATKRDLGTPAGTFDLAISVVTDEGIAALTRRLSVFAAELAGEGEPSLVSRERDRERLAEAVAALEFAIRSLGQPELAAEQLRIASTELERLLGKIDPEMILDRLFSSFCIGK
ncbi:MAG TPA: tRNA uridine-5-carboxymethylaminomethyl(34) synthesis GTPase MnmE [Devosiaceae bacterium]|jgi:tRNA modification GTPase